MGYLKVALAALAAFGKFGWLFKFLPFLGPLPAILMGAVSFVGKFLYWLCADIADAFKEPWRFVVRTICVLAAIGFGIYVGHGLAAKRIEAVNAKITQMKDDWKKRDDEDAKKAEAAKAAREQAESPAAGAAAAPVQRVRAKRPAARAKAQPGLLGSLFPDTKRSR